MPHWFCLINDEDWETIKKKWIWELPETAEIRLGDSLVLCSMGKVVGIYRAISNVFKSRIKISESRPPSHQIELRPTDFVPKRPVDFKSIQGLEFVKTKNWEKSPIREISEEDFRSIREHISKTWV